MNARLSLTSGLEEVTRPDTRDLSYNCCVSTRRVVWTGESDSTKQFVVPTNIAEGCGHSSGNFGRFLQIATGSASETEYHLILATDLGYLSVDESQALIQDVTRSSDAIGTHATRSENKD